MTGRNSKNNGRFLEMTAAIALLLTFLFVTSTCKNGGRDGGSSSEPATDVTDAREDTSITVRDMAGREITFDRTPERIIGLRAGALRLITWLNASDMVAGIEEPERNADRPYLFAHPELRERPVIGPLMGGDAELLVAARPDVIFMTFATSGQADELQNQTGIPVVVLDYGDFAERRGVLLESLELMGRVLGREERAEELTRFIRSSIRDLKDRTGDVNSGERPRAYVGGISYRGAQGINATEPHYPPFRFAGIDNVAADLDEQLINPIDGTFIDKEQLLMWNPDVLFVDLSSWQVVQPEIRSGTPLYNGLSAIGEGRVYGLLPYNNYAANYEHMLINAWYAGKQLYPGRFDDIDMADKADSVYKAFLGRGVYDQVSGTMNGGLRSLSGEL